MRMAGGRRERTGTNMEKINGLALCAGVSGLELGLHIALGNRYRTVGYCEREAFAASVLVARMEEKALDEAPIWDDLFTFPCELYRGKVDILTAGFPCPPVSCAGKRRGVEDPRWLWPHVARIIGEVRPGLVYLENVRGLVSEGTAFGAVLGGLAGLGYDAEWGCVTAASVGASHKRERVFILGFPASPVGASRLSTGGSEWASLAGSTGADLAFSPLGLRAASGRDGQPPCDGETVDDSAGARLDGTRGGPAADAGSRKCVSGGGCSALADGGGRELAGRAGQLCDDESAIAALARSGLPLFPPGPGDLDAWRRILEIDPTLEPAIRRVADGLATELDGCRADRLRACGNGVVALQAAYAFVRLAGRIGLTLSPDSSQP